MAVFTESLLTLTLRGGRIHVVSDGVNVGYVNLMARTALCLPIDEFEHTVNLAKVKRMRDAKTKEKK